MRNSKPGTAKPIQMKANAPTIIDDDSASCIQKRRRVSKWYAWRMPIEVRPAITRKKPAIVNASLTAVYNAAFR